MSMKSYKVSGLDSFQPIFFKMYWEVVGDDVWKFFARAFQRGMFDPRVMKALLVLIPMEDSLTTVKHFRPISLLNVI